MKNPAVFSFLRSLAMLFLLVFFGQNFTYAQNPATPDTSFGLGTFNGTVRDIKIQTDGKILTGGNFTYYKSTQANRLVRLNQDGTVDNTFNIGTGANGAIAKIALQSDGKIIVGGNFTSFNGIAINYLIRLNPDGSVDNTFNSNLIGTVYTIAIQAGGKILVGGWLMKFNGASDVNFARLNTDGSVDNTFVGPGANAEVNSIAFQSDGKILVGGLFSLFNGVSKKCLVRLDSEGSVDNTFDIGSGAGPSLDPNFPFVAVTSIAPQTDGKILLGGTFGTFNGLSKKRIVRLNSDGSVDNTFNIGSGANSDVNSIAFQADGKVLVGGRFLTFNGISQNRLVRLNSDGSIDNTFNIGTGANATVYNIAIQPDGRVLAGGDFVRFNRVPKNSLIRLNTNGSIDNTFNIGMGVDNGIHAITIQPDGKILVGGWFSTFNGVSINRLIRLNADGSIDNTFNIGTGVNGNYVYNIAIQPDGKILVGGEFTTFNGVPKNNLVRLNADGSIDNTFNIGSGASYRVHALALQPDGKILVGGEFTTFNGVSINRLIRLNADGSLDNTFNIGTGANNDIKTLVIQADGKIFVGGRFTSFNGVSKNYLVHLNADGSIYNTFNINTWTNNIVHTIALQPDGKILVGGFFSSFNGLSKYSIVRLNENGSLDNTFISTGPNGIISKLVLQADGKILVGGWFSTFNGVSKNHIVRLNADGSIDNSFNIGMGTTPDVLTLALQADGKILLGGSFASFNNIAYNGMIRLQGDPVHYNIIRGNIFTDSNNDCNFQTTENRIQSVIIKALPGPYYGGSDAYGNYQVKVDSGAVSYTLSQQFNSINSKLLLNQCAPSYNVSLSGASKDTCCFNFADSIKACALLNISVQNTRMRRCFKNNTFVSYCNYGNASASGTQVKVIYPSYIVPISSVPMWTLKQDSVLIYDLGILAANACDRITIIDSVICGNESIRGLTQCIKATISPASNCVAENPAWDRSSMKVTGTCTNDNAVFTIINSGSGNMTGSHEYRVYVNDTLIFTGIFQLNSGESFTVTYPAAGQTIRVEADQHTLHPGKSRPRATVENCGVASPEVRNLVTTAPQDDLDEETAITCNIIRDSYDPNDKQTMPEGIGATNMVAPGTELEYTIRFQNTGTDTAYTVRIVDTLDIALDAGSFTQGASSHPYTLNISGKNQAVLAFNFYNINLPDSTTNKLASNGLVSFRITVPSGTTLGTEIKNKAHIFFDYNSAIITNETMHTVDITVPSDLARGSLVQVGPVINGVSKRFSGSVKIYPNPTQGIVTVEIPEQGNNTEMRVVSLLGVVQKSIQLSNTSKQEVNLEGIKQGMYLYEIWMEGERRAGGMLEIK